MKTLATLLTAATLAFGANLALAKDLGPDEALRLRDAGTIQSFEKLNEAALAKHPGATIEETELEEEYGRYVYQLELRDAKGVQWDLELDAKTGEVLKNHQDD
ncbi:PepSY domain-containing protein [Pseudomonas lopnurensis]|uniref:PepSY domain-containing protein n=1 Tax=Pseudomonas lopnurensis TaxID=1477517 RepID=UPI001879FC3D|nr:PepSY domain-containing protein [Pseudomonas lopnurensis]MBE7375840.1 PepSY domain-containing protein [Pseudomonas lopnurensis]